jgi:argininosuccinate synthase
MIEIGFERGDAVAIDGEAMSPGDAADRAQRPRPRQRHRPPRPGREPLRRHEVARHLRDARRHDPARRPPRIESITLDRGAAHLKDELMPRYAELIYNGFWFSPEREMLQALIDKSQEHVEGTVRLKLYKGNVIVTGRKSRNRSIPRRCHLRGRRGAYDQKDAEGFIRLNAGAGQEGFVGGIGLDQREVALEDGDAVRRGRARSPWPA